MKTIRMLKGKLHMATVTEANINYEGSITIDEDLMEAAGILPYEFVLISNMQNGERFETYVIKGPRKSGVICLNGATARKAVVGDKLFIFSIADMTEEDARAHKPRIIFLDDKNRQK